MNERAHVAMMHRHMTVTMMLLIWACDLCSEFQETIAVSRVECVRTVVYFLSRYAISGTKCKKIARGLAPEGELVL